MKKAYGKYALRVVIGIMLGLLLAGNAGATTLTVCPSGCAYSGIQTAINAASSGDTILVQNGTYWKVNVTKQLTLRGIGMPVVDANGSGSAIILAQDTKPISILVIFYIKNAITKRDRDIKS